MPTKLTQMPCGFCSEDCPLADISIDKEMLYIKGNRVNVRNAISCTYEKVCKMWNKRLQETKERDDER